MSMSSLYTFVHFNSIKVQLELTVVFPSLTLLINFNSIKVQLEPLVRVSVPVASRFQFHKGTIRTGKKHQLSRAFRYFNSIKVQLERGAAVGGVPGALVFQFHKGTIRTHLLDLNIQQNEISIP